MNHLESHLICCFEDHYEGEEYVMNSILVSRCPVGNSNRLTVLKDWVIV